MAQSYSVEAVLSVQDQMSGAFQKAAANASSLSSAVNGAASSINVKMAAAGAAISAFGVSSVKNFANFENGLNKAAVVAGGTSKDIDGLGDVAIKMSNSLGISAQECSAAFMSMARDGASVSDIKREFPAIAQAATAAGENIADVAGVVQNAMNVWGGSIESPQRAAAVLVQTANQSNASIQSMQQGLANMAPVASQAGVSLQDTSTALGLLTNKGFSTAQASQDLAHAILQMVAPSAKAKATMSDLGISFVDSAGKMKPLPSILTELNEKMSGMGDAAKTAALKNMFGIAGYQAIAPLMQSMADKTGDAKTSWDAFSKSVNDASSSTAVATKFLQSQAGEMTQNLGAKLQILKQSWTNFGIVAQQSNNKAAMSMVDFASKALQWASTSNSSAAGVIRSMAGLAPVIGPALTTASGFFTKFNAVVTGTKTIASGVSGVMKSAGAAVGLFGSKAQSSASGANVAKTATQGLGTAANTTKGGILGMVGSLMKNPWTYVIAGTAAAGASLFQFFTKTTEGQAMWSQFSSFLSTTWSQLAPMAQTAFGAIVSTLDTVWSNIFSAVQAAWPAIQNVLVTIWNGLAPIAQTVFPMIGTVISTVWNAILAITQAVWPVIQTILSTVWNWIATYGPPIFNAIGTVISTVWNAIVAVTQTVWPIIQTVVTNVWNFLQSVCGPIFQAIGTIITTVWNTVSNVTSTVWTSIQNIVSSIWNALCSIASSVFNAIKDVITSVWNAIQSITQGVWNIIHGFLTGNWNQIQSGASSIFNAIKSVISSVWNAISSITTSVWNGISSTLSSIWNGIRSTATSIWNGIRSMISSVWDGIRSDISNLAQSAANAIHSAWDGLTGWVSNLWNGIKSTIQSAMNFDLFSAGSRIMNSFLDGLQSAWSAVKNFVSGIGDWIQAHKGPVSYDKKLLIPAGKAIMNGLNNGLVNGFSSVKSTINAITHDIGSTVVPALDTTEFDNGINNLRTANNNLASGTIRGEYAISMNQQPAYINLTLGGHDFGAYVDDISKEQGAQAILKSNYRL